MSALNADQALERLKEGNFRFRQEQETGEGRDKTRRRELVESQAPYAVILTCADSRVSPELAFDVGLGELFLVRVVGNIANTSSIASIEYAVAVLGAKLVVVMAHQGCGGVTAAVAGGDAGKNMNHLLKHIRPAVDAAPDEDIDGVARLNAKFQAEWLVRGSEIIRGAMEDAGVRVVTAFYQLATGEVAFEA